MSKLFFSERGRALLGNSEEITHWRWARKRFELPDAAADAGADICYPKTGTGAWTCVA